MRLNPVQHRRTFRRRRPERGATIVIVALTMVVLLGMAAVSIDYGVASTRYNDAQSAADAAALAVAQECANQRTGCNATTAEYMVAQNAGPDARVTLDKPPNVANGQVKVTVSETVPAGLGKVVGAGSTTVSRSATAKWNLVPLKASKMIPIGLPYCMWKDYNPVSGTGSKKGATVQFVWSKFKTSETSCAGVTPTTAATVYGRAASSGSNLTGAGRALYFTKDVVPGLSFNCAYSPGLWDLYRDDLADWSILTYDSCMGNEFNGVGPGSIIMLPIYAVEKKNFIFNFITYNSRVVVVGFAPFKIQDFVWYPVTYWGEEPGRESLLDILDAKHSYANSCTFGLGVGIPNVFSFLLGGRCSGIRGQFVSSTDSALFKDFTEFGTSYSNPTSGVGGNAPNLGGVKVQLVK